MKRWWARVNQGDTKDKYGRWVPTGCTDKNEAVEYMRVYPGMRLVVEWLLL